MRKILFILSLVLLAACSKGQSGVLGVVATPSGHVGESWAGKTVVFYGDSITEGVGATTTANRWTTQLTALKDNTEVNMGVSGRSMMDMGCGNGNYLASDLPTKTSAHKYLFMALGVNDLTRRHPTLCTPENYEQALKDFVDDAAAKGWAASEIVIVTPYLITYYNYLACGAVTYPDRAFHLQFVQAAKDAALAKGTILADVFTMMDAQPSEDAILNDGVHPNNAGYTLIANFMNALDYSVYAGD